MLHASGPLVAPETLKWSYFNGQLRFKIVDVADDGLAAFSTQAHPWRKVG